MERLKDRLKEVMNRWDCMVKFPHGNENCILPELYGCVAEDCAEEARKLAIEFAKSLNGMCIGSWNLEHTYNELFNKFIDEYYG